MGIAASLIAPSSVAAAQPAAYGGSASVSASSPSYAASASAAVQAGSPIVTGKLSNSGPSASFLAQLYGQDGASDDATALAGNVARFAPAPIYNAFVQYGYIKYRPSDAGIPQQSVSLPAASGQTNTAAGQNDNHLPTRPANDYQAYANTQSRNRSNLFPGGQQLVISG